MKQPTTLPWFLTPPSLSMDEYVAFVEELLAQADPEQVARQKALEEQITQPFRLVPAAEERAPAVEPKGNPSRVP